MRNHISGSVVAVVVVNYGSMSMVERNLAGLAGAPDCRVVVVDNFTSSAERSAVKAACARLGWKAVLLDANRGFGAGVNAGLDAARQFSADGYLLINPDATTDLATVRALHEHVRADPDALVAPRIVRPDGSNWSVGSGIDLRTGRIRSRPGLRDLGPNEAGWLSGACLALSAQLLHRIGGMDDGYFLYWEDVDFSLRVQQAGGRLAVREDLTVVHREGGTQRIHDRQRRLSDRYFFYNCRNRLVFASRQLNRREVGKWIAATPRQSWAILLRGGRRQLLRTPRPMIAAAAGSLVGVSIVGLRLIRPSNKPSTLALRATNGGRRAAIVSSTPPSQGASSAERVRLYESLRTAHLERALRLAPAQILYRIRRYDFDDQLANEVDLVQAGTLAAAIHLLRSDRLTALEINEPLMLESLPRTAACLIAIRLRELRGAERVRVVTYAIGNADPFNQHSPRLRSRARKVLERVLSLAVWHRVDRIAFGTQGAMDVYDTLLPRRLGPRERILIPALPAPELELSTEVDQDLVIYVGALVPRKGFDLVLQSWPAVKSARPRARLLVLGKGPLENEATAAARSDPSITVRIDPPRTEIGRCLARSAVAVLPSQPTPTWREQVGLPIVEALAHGCSVVATSETGLADWLRDHGHQVIDVPTSPAALCDAIIRALDVRRPKHSVVADLPAKDGRLAADSWMFRTESAAQA